MFLNCEQDVRMIGILNYRMKRKMSAKFSKQLFTQNFTKQSKSMAVIFNTVSIALLKHIV
jgi:hypothetical protein